MIILVDTNVVLDVLMKREPYTEAAQHILTKCANREIVGYLAAAENEDFSDFEDCLQEECGSGMLVGHG